MTWSSSTNWAAAGHRDGDPDCGTRTDDLRAVGTLFDRQFETDITTLDVVRAVRPGEARFSRSG